MSNTSYAMIMLVAGIGIPVLAAMNAALGREIGAPASASVILFAVAFLASLCVAIFAGVEPFQRAIFAPKHLFLAGALVAFYVLSITFIAPHLGVGNAVFFVLLGQLISAGLIDHYGLFGATQVNLSLTRGAGILLMAGGVFLTQVVAKT